VNRGDVRGAVRGIAEHLPEDGDVLRQAVLADEAVGPDSLHELVFFDHAFGVGHEHLEQVESFGCQRDDLVAPLQLSPAKVQSKGPELIAAGRMDLVHARGRFLLNCHRQRCR
jgi:hypothetical protein